MCPRDKPGRNCWPEERYSKEQVDTSSLRVFGDFNLRCPGDPESYLDRTYGSSWPSQGSTHYFCHQSAGLCRTTQFSIAEEATFLPARPFH